MRLRDHVEAYIKEHPGCVASEIAAAYPTDDRQYGNYKRISLIIADLRKKGKLDDCERCDHCKRALTRARRNVPLFWRGN